MTTLKFMGSALTATLLAQPAAAQVPYSPRGEILSAPIVIGQVPRIIAKVTGPVCDLCEDDRLAQILRNTGYVLLATPREGGA
jgi:hypothetical protein